MAKKQQSLDVVPNSRTTGRLTRETSGTVDFRDDPVWLEWRYAIPVSLAMPLREKRYVGGVIAAVFDNLMPDNRDLKRHIAERTGAGGIDVFSL